MCLAILLLTPLLHALASSSCCSVSEDQKGCDNTECEDFVCHGGGIEGAGDGYCCSQWWNPYCAKAAAAIGPMSDRDPYFVGDPNLTRGCQVCRVPSPPPLPAPPPRPPRPPPAPFIPEDDNNNYAASICIIFDSVATRDEAVASQGAFLAAVADTLGLWIERMGVQMRPGFGCHCGPNCGYNGCFLPDASTWPSVTVHVIDVPHARWPPGNSMRQVCDNLLDNALQCFGCTAAGPYLQHNLSIKTGKNVVDAVVIVNKDSMGWDSSRAIWLLIGLFFIAWSWVYLPCMLLSKMFKCGRRRGKDGWKLDPLNFKRRDAQKIFDALELNAARALLHSKGGALRTTQCECRIPWLTPKRKEEAKPMIEIVDKMNDAAIVRHRVRCVRIGSLTSTVNPCSPSLPPISSSSFISRLSPHPLSSPPLLPIPSPRVYFSSLHPAGQRLCACALNPTERSRCNGAAAR